MERQITICSKCLDKYYIHRQNKLKTQFSCHAGITGSKDNKGRVPAELLCEGIMWLKGWEYGGEQKYVFAIALV